MSDGRPHTTLHNIKAVTIDRNPSEPPRWRRWFFRSVKVVVLSAVVLLALRVYYALTPVELTAEAQDWNSHANALPVDTENGLRMLGLLAPEGMDAVDYGRCLLAQDRSWQSPVHDHPTSNEPTERERVERCSPRPHTPLNLDLQRISSITLATSNEDWTTLETTPLHSVLSSRYQTMIRQGPRYLGHDFLDPIFRNSPVVLAMHRIHAAKAVTLWKQGHRDQATAHWQAQNAFWAIAGGENIVQSMHAVGAHTQTLLAMRHALSGDSSPLSAEQAADLLQAIQPIQAMPQALSHSFLGEWNVTQSALSQTPVRLQDHLLRLVWDERDTLNRLARSHTEHQRLALAAANGNPQERADTALDTPWCQGPLLWLCQPLARNPFGMLLDSQDVSPTYTSYGTSYGTRVADLRNLAAATRLTIEVRRQGLSGEALAHFVAHAPDNMRDVFTRQPFAYNLQTRELTIVLREKSPVLGDPGEYRLPI